MRLVTWTSCLWFVACALGVPGLVRAEPTVTPDERVQSALVEMAHVVRSDPVDFYRRALALWGRDIAPQNEFLRQLMYFASRPDNAGMPIPRDLIFAKVVRLLEIPRLRVTYIAADYLASADPGLNELAASWVGGRQRRTGASVSDFTTLTVYLNDHKGTDRDPVIDVMFCQNPSEALLCLPGIFHLDRETTKSLILAEHDISDVHWKHAWKIDTADEQARAAGRLNELALSDKWWVRRYAAEVVWECPEFADPALVKKLRDDREPLVGMVLDRPVNRR